jgi:hypothetical protein
MSADSLREFWRHDPAYGPSIDVYAMAAEIETLRTKNADLTRRIRTLAETVVAVLGPHATHPTIRADYAALKAELETRTDG